MTAGDPILRRKIAERRAGQPPLDDVAHVGEMTARILEERLRQGVNGAAGCRFRDAEVALFGQVADGCAPTTLIATAESGGKLAALMPLSAGFLHELTEALTGANKDGGGRGARADRAPTAIDEALAESFVSGLLSCFEKSIAPTGVTPASQTGLRFARYARTPASILELNETSELLRMALELVFSAEQEEPLVVELYLTLDALDGYALAARRARAVRRAPEADGDAPDSLWAVTMLRAANCAEIRMVSVMRELRLSVEEVSALTTGSIIELAPGDGMRVELRLEGAGGGATPGVICTGRLGAHRVQRAVRIETPPDEALAAALARYAL